MNNKDKKKRLPDRIIECPVCESAWNISAFTRCDCGAKMIFTEQWEEIGEPSHRQLSGKLSHGLRLRLEEKIKALQQMEAHSGWGTSHIKISYGAGVFYLQQVLEWFDESIPSSEPAKESQPTTEIPHEILHWIHEEWVKDGCRGVFPVWRDSAIATYRHMSLAVPLHAEQSQLHAFNQDMYSAWCEGAATERDDKPKGNLFPYPALFNIWFERNYLALHARPKPEPSEEKDEERWSLRDFQDWVNSCAESDADDDVTLWSNGAHAAYNYLKKGNPSPPSVKPDEMRSLTDKEAEVLDKTLYRTAKKERSVKPEREDNWISIKESPEEYRQVLLWFEGLKTIAIGYLINGSWADENKNLLWCEPDHWAAMPTPPSHPSSAPPAVQQEDKRRGLKAFDDSMKDTLGQLTEDNPFTGNDHQEDGEVPEADRFLESLKTDLIPLYTALIGEGRNSANQDKFDHWKALQKVHDEYKVIHRVIRLRFSALRQEFDERLKLQIQLEAQLATIRQEKEDYRSVLERIASNWSEGPRYEAQSVLDKYTPQNPTNA